MNVKNYCNMGKINIAEILKDCPKGTKLYSPLCGECYFDRLNIGTIICKKQNTQEITFTSKGYYMLPVFGDCECLLFPSKECRDWSKFQKPFKNGDIVFYNDTIAIFKEWGDETLFRTYVTKYLCSDSLIDKNVPLFGKSVRKEVRLATEDEKQKLFQAIKDNGYKWNPETKTLEKLVESNPYSGVSFKYNGHTWGMCARDNGVEILVDGEIKERVFLDNKLQGKSAFEVWKDMRLEVYQQASGNRHEPNCSDDTTKMFSLNDIDEIFEKIAESCESESYHWTINDAKDGDVLAFDDDTIVIFKDLYNKTTFHSYCHIEDGVFSISELDCPDWWDIKFKPATKEQRDFLFQKIKEAGYEWNPKTKTLKKLPKFKVGDIITKRDSIENSWVVSSVSSEYYGLQLPKGCEGIGTLPIIDQDKYELIPNKFDITTLKPFEKVLVRNKSNEVWTANFYSHYDATSDKPFICVGWSEMNEYRYCIPYEVNNELLGTTNNTEEYGSR